MFPFLTTFPKKYSVCFLHICVVSFQFICWLWSTGGEWTSLRVLESKWWFQPFLFSALTILSVKPFFLDLFLSLLKTSLGVWGYPKFLGEDSRMCVLSWVCTFLMVQSGLKHYRLYKITCITFIHQNIFWLADLSIKSSLFHSKSCEKWPEILQLFSVSFLPCLVHIDKTSRIPCSVNSH